MESFDLISRFASELGWHGLVPHQITVPENSGPTPTGTIVTFYATTDLKFFLQVNQKVPGQFGSYRATVAAERYDIRNINFEECKFDSIDGALSEAARLYTRLARTNFRNPKWRRLKLEQNPDKRCRKMKRRGWKGMLKKAL